MIVYIIILHKMVRLFLNVKYLVNTTSAHYVFSPTDIICHLKKITTTTKIVVNSDANNIG